MPATLPVDPGVEVVCQLGFATLVADPLALEAPCVVEPVLEAPCVVEPALVAGLLEPVVAGFVLLFAALPLRPEVEPVL